MFGIFSDFFKAHYEANNFWFLIPLITQTCVYGMPLTMQDTGRNVIVTLSEIGTWRLKIDCSSAIYSCRKHVYQIWETVLRIQWDSRDVVSSLSALYGKNTCTNGCHESSMLPSEVELSFKVAKDTSVTFQSYWNYIRVFP